MFVAWDGLVVVEFLCGVLFVMGFRGYLGFVGFAFGFFDILFMVGFWMWYLRAYGGWFW